MESSSAVSSLSFTWPGTTTVGRFLFRYLVLIHNDVAHTVTDPAGWGTPVLQVDRVATGLPKVSIYVWRIDNASARSGAENVSWTGGAVYAMVGGFEASGAVTASAIDRSATATGAGTTGAGTGTTAATAQAEELVIGILASPHTDTHTLTSSPTGSTTTRHSAPNAGSDTNDKGRVTVWSDALSATQTAGYVATIGGAFTHNYAGVVFTIKAPISGGGGGGGSDSLVTVFDDTYNRTVPAGGLGTADTGQTYALRGTSPDYSVNGTQALVNVPAPNTSRRATPNTISELDTDQTVIVICDELAQGANNELSVWARVSADGNTAYRLSLQIIPTTDQLQWRLQAMEGGIVRTIGTVQTEAFSYTAGLTLQARFKVKGTNPTTLSAKVWRSTDAEPAAFELVVTDAGATLQTAGAIAMGVFVGTGATAAPVLFRWTRWTASRVVTGGATGSVTRTPSDRAVGAASGGGGGGNPLPTGIGLRLGDQSSRSSWESMHAGGFDAGYQGIYLSAAEVHPSPGTFRFYEPAGGPGSGAEDSVIHARLKGYRLGIRLAFGFNTPQWYYTHATRPVAKLTLLNSDANANTGTPIDCPVPWDLPSSSGSPHAPSSSGTNLFFWANQLMAGLAAWMNTSIPDPLNPGQQIKRSSVIEHVTVSIPATEGTEMSHNYGQGDQTDYTSIKGHNLQQWQQWSSYSGAPPALVGNVVTKSQPNEDARRADMEQAWVDAIVASDNAFRALGVKTSVMYGSIFSDAQRGAINVIRRFEDGGELVALRDRMLGGYTNFRANYDSNGFILFDTGLDASYNAVGVARNTPGPRTWEGWAARGQNEVLSRMVAMGMQRFIQGAAVPVYTSSYAGSGPTAAFRAAILDVAETWHARWIETLTSLIMGNGAAIGDSSQFVSDVQAEQRAIAVADGYVSGGGGGGGIADTIATTKIPGGGSQTFVRPIADVAIATLSTDPDDSVAVTRIPFVPGGGGGSGTGGGGSGGSGGGGTPTVPRARWTFVLTDRLGEPLADLSSIATSRALSLGIGIPWGLRFSMPQMAAETDLVLEGITRVKGYRDGILRFYGTTWTGVDALSADSETIEVQCWDAMQYAQAVFADVLGLGRRRQKFADVQLHSIARQLLDRTVDDSLANASPFPFEWGRLVTGGSTPARSIVFDPGTRLLAAWQALSDRRDGIEFVCRPVEGTLRTATEDGARETFELMGVLDVSYPRIGGISSVIFAYGGAQGNVGQVERTRDLWGVVNEPIAQATNQGGSGNRFAQWRAPRSVGRFGRFQRQGQFDNARGTNRLQLLARGMLVPEVPRTFTITPNENGPRVFDDFNLGDTVHVNVDRGRVHLDDDLRITDLELTISDDGFETGSAVTVGEIDTPEDSA